MNREQKRSAWIFGFTTSLFTGLVLSVLFSYNLTSNLTESIYNLLLLVSPLILFSLIYLTSTRGKEE